MAKSEGGAAACGGFLVLLVLFVLPVYGIISEIKLAQTVEIQPLKSYAWLVAITTCLMYIPLFLTCAGSAARQYLISLLVITIWSGFTTGVVGINLIIRNLPDTLCIGRTVTPVCGYITVIKWNSWAVYGLGTLLVIVLLREKLLLSLFMLGIPLTVAVHQLVQAVYTTDSALSALLFLLGVSTCLVIVTPFVTPLVFRPERWFLTLITSVQFYIWLAMSAGSIGYTILYIEREKRPCTSYFCRAKTPILAITWYCWFQVLCVVAIMLSARMNNRFQGWLDGGRVASFPVSDDWMYHIIQPIVHEVALIFQLVVFRDKLLSTPSLQRFALFLAIGTGASLVLSSIVTSSRDLLRGPIQGLHTIWHIPILIPPIGITVFLAYAVVSYTMEWTKLPPSRCSLDVLYSAGLYCKLQTVTLAMSWVIWVSCLISSGYLVFLVGADQLRRRRKRIDLQRQWDEHYANAGPIGGHMQGFQMGPINHMPAGGHLGDGDGHRVGGVVIAQNPVFIGLVSWIGLKREPSDDSGFRIRLPRLGRALEL